MPLPVPTLATRHAPIRALALTLALSGASLPAAAATVVIDTFGSGDSFDTGASGLFGPGPTGTIELGFVFTAPVSTSVGTLSVALSSNAPPAVATFTLYGWTGTTVTAPVDLTPVKLVSAQPSVLTVVPWVTPLVAGQHYAMFVSAPAEAFWWQALGTPTLATYYILNGAAPQPAGWVPALRLEMSTPGPALPVPLPGAAGGLAGALAALCLLVRHRTG